MTADFASDVASNAVNRVILSRWDRLDLPGSWLVAGCLFQTVWNLKTGLTPEYDIKDYDIFYFDPAEDRRGLGTYGVLREIAHARDAGIPYYYLGFWIDGCRTMLYKRDLRPNELLHPDGVWR